MRSSLHYGPYSEWAGVYFVLLGIALLISLRYFYKKRQMYTGVNYLFFLASVVSAIVLHSMDCYYKLPEAGINVDMNFILLYYRSSLTVIFFSVIWVTLATLMDYGVIKITERNRLICAGAINVLMYLVLCYFKWFTTPEAELDLKVYLMIYARDVLRTFDFYPLLYACTLEGWRYDLVKKQAKENSL